ncbi:MAG: glycosyl hydrolase 2 galactose-binding domain-containing protein [Nitrososphaerales archaeon]
MVRSTLNLSAASWSFGQAPRQSFSAQPHDDRAAVVGWLPARVPGDVRTDLLAAGRIPSLDTPEDLAASEWVDDADWWYRTEIDAVEPGMTGVIEADGIDYLSGIWLDGRLLATHQGMFARQSIVLPSQIHASGRHELAVRIWGAGTLPRLPNSPVRRVMRWLLNRLGLVAEFFPGRMATPKAQFSFGWDFAPRVLSTGIWDDIRLVHCRGTYLSDIRAQAEPLSGDDPTPVRWEVSLRVARRHAAGLRARVEVRSAEGQAVRLSQDTFDLGDAHNSLLVFDSTPLARWWPWDQGQPNLYRLTVCLLDESGPVDEAETVVGVRTVRRERFPNGQPWRFTINGRPVFLRGANWVPADILPGRLAGEDYAHLTGLARKAGINFLRVWGGGIREKRAFWEQCNRLGIMAMQEFPLSCAFLDHYPRDPDYLAVLQSEAEGIVSALRNHPSLIAWCGGNEISPRRERLSLRTIERVLEREDSARPWIPASPSQGDIHNWDVWHGGAPWQAFSRVNAPFMSEFGLQALPQIATVREMFPAALPLSLDDPRWEARKLQAAKLRRNAGPLPEDDLVATIEATQRTQAAGLQAGIEPCRIRREGSPDRHSCGGLAFWQFNEPWPVVSWSVIDRLGRPKAAYDMLLRSYQPLLVAARFNWRRWRAGDRFVAELWLVNDTSERFDECSVEAFVDGRPAYQVADVTLPPAQAFRIGSLSVCLATPPSSLELTLARSGVVLARNEYDLTVYLPPPQPPGSWLMRRVADLLLQIG